MSCCTGPDDGLTPYDQALRLIAADTPRLPAETVPLDQALGRFLAEPACAAADSPRFEQSAMDGFAVRLDDVAETGPDAPAVLRLDGELPAGDARALTLEPGRTIKVYTGSRLPGGTGAVVMKEYVTVDGGRARIAWNPAPGEHIRRVGEEYRRGDEILPAATFVTPPVVGMLAMLGFATARVGGLPRAGVVTMGDELAPAGRPVGPGQIHDGNGPALAAALRALGLVDVTAVRVGDDPDDLERAMAELLASCGLLITAGGASVGDHDHVETVRARLGVAARYRRLAIKPGKPNYFGLSPAGVPVFGLPGNPVSALVSFHQLVRPAVRQMMGGPAADAPAPGLPAVLDRTARKSPDRMEWLRARLQAGDGDVSIAVLDRGQGSHMLSGLARADVLAELPRTSSGIEAGAPVTARPLDWRF
jgi:molybdopterin molybdotransferase